MSKKTAIVLEQLIKTLELQNFPKIGGVYKHISSGYFYRVTSYALESKGNGKLEEKVVYTPHYAGGPKVFFVRKLGEFRSRFEKISTKN